MHLNRTKIIFLLFVFFLQSCVTPKNTYRLLVGARAENYIENESIPIDQSLAQVLGGTVTTVSGDPKQITTQATGFQIGFIEETKEGFVTTLSFLYTIYTPVSFTFNSSNYGVITEKLSPSAAGLDATIGYNFLKNKFKIRPDLSYKTETQSFEITATGSSTATSQLSNYKQRVFVWGGGIAFEYALGKEDRVILQIDYRVPSRSTTGVSSLSYTSAQLSWAYGNWIF